MTNRVQILPGIQGTVLFVSLSAFFHLAKIHVFVLFLAGTSVQPLLALNWIIDRSVKGAPLRYSFPLQNRHVLIA